MPDGLIGDIALPSERRSCETLPTPARCHWDRLLFSIKESVYKAWFPLAERWLGFEDALVEIDPGQRAFTARFLVPGPALGGSELTEISGRWFAGEGWFSRDRATPVPTRGSPS